MATWYAQNSTVNIDSANEWNAAADGSGAWLTWGNLGATDILEANAKTAIEINVDSFTCGSIKTDSGGGFTVNLAAGNNRTINADILAGSTKCLVRSGTTKTLTINGDITGGSGANCYGLNNASGTGTVVTGDVTGGTNGTAYGIARTAYGAALTITGNLLAATGPAVQAGSLSSITVTGNITAVAGKPAIIYYAGSYTVILTGNLVYAADGTCPVAGANTGFKLKWDNVASGATASVRDGSLNAHTIKKPDYPTEAQVESGVDFDYTNLTGTLAGGGGLVGMAMLAGRQK